MDLNKQPRQAIHGLFLLNKPIGISSNDALQIVKHTLGAQKAGHAGTLDPLACGLLVILLGEATKFANTLINENKTYEVTARLGITTSTGDIEGKIIEKKQIPKLTKDQIIDVLKGFQGEIEQTPPIYSALKQQGKPLYELARKNIPIFIEKKSIYVNQIDLINFDQKFIKLKIECSKGTYIRTLIEDLGKRLECGAHCAYLRRTTIANFTLENSYSLFDLKEHAAPLSLLTSLDQIIPEHEKTFLSEAAAYYLFKGQSIIYPWTLPSHQKTLYLHLKKGNFLGIGKILPNNRLAPVRLIDPKYLS